MSKILLKNYKLLIKEGKRLKNKYYLFFILKISKGKGCILKASVKKKVGIAVKRNYEKRIIRIMLKKFNYNNDLFILCICLRKPEMIFSEKYKLFKETLKDYIKDYS